MVDVKKAIANAQDYLRALIPQAELIRLEEVESADDAWKITLSFLPVESIAAPSGGRQFKLFDVAKDSGEVRSMKIRTLDGVWPA